jgi:hypothetical protein
MLSNQTVTDSSRTAQFGNYLSQFFSVQTQALNLYISSV